jgi:hypothetical protein
MQPSPHMGFSEAKQILSTSKSTEVVRNWTEALFIYQRMGELDLHKADELEILTSCRCSPRNGNKRNMQNYGEEVLWKAVQ